MPSVTRFVSAAAAVSVAAAAVLNLPIIVQNGYKTVQIDMGTPAKTYRLLFDTGSSSSWAVDSKCARSTCANVSGYNRVGYSINDSTSGSYTGGHADIAYLGGNASGLTVSETWAAGGISWRQDFIATNKTNWAAMAGDGFLGLGFSSIIDGGANTVVETLMAQGRLDEAKSGIYYGTEHTQTAEVAGVPGPGPGDGVLTIGGSREADFVDGELVTMPVMKSIDGRGYDVWRTVIQAINGTRKSADGKVVLAETQTRFHSDRVVFDTGAGSITLPREQAVAAYESIGWNYTALLRGDHVPLCSEFDASWSFKFTFGDYRFEPRTVEVTGEQLRRPGFAHREDACWPPFEAGGGGLVLIGTPFLRNFYTVWDYGAAADEKDPGRFEPKLSFGKLKKGYY
ncbi:putative vacuolar protease A [Colletotrichum tanaceti]|uniref:Putative vacuolar protease A n=1 Tax=Colletotrichum tanaceti TaxID=1306861 RepID=A0A4U6XMV9_9PEZI|nr:putative vacuolar protease A [Colletotrichum tanaceti]